jgi:LuxR family transcriptional regulator, maltose regulon positive regulatory protein
LERTGIYQAKIVPPRLHHVILRERAFRLLDDLQEYPVTWISSPAGSGKTTLVASYAQARAIPLVWYRVDETDTDDATLF